MHNNDEDSETASKFNYLGTVLLTGEVLLYPEMLMGKALKHIIRCRVTKDI